MSSGEASGLTLRWSRVYHPEWDETPEAYVALGVVAWARSRRLLRADDARLGLRAYLGVQHNDPTRWGLPGEPRATFFLSVLLGRRTLFLRAYPTVAAGLAALHDAHRRLLSAGGLDPIR